MQSHSSIITERLILRRWKPSDAHPFFLINSDPKVMRFMFKILNHEESDRIIQKIEDHFDVHGFSFWALETKDTQQFIGFTGLAIPSFISHFTPCVEIGWRLAKNYWGKGFATEAAKAALHYGFTTAGLKEIVSFTAPINLPSIAVMERIGMKRNPVENFDHPNLPQGHPLQKHILYRLKSNA